MCELAILADLDETLEIPGSGPRSPRAPVATLGDLGNAQKFFWRPWNQSRFFWRPWTRFALPRTVPHRAVAISAAHREYSDSNAAPEDTGRSASERIAAHRGQIPPEPHTE